MARGRRVEAADRHLVSSCSARRPGKAGQRGAEQRLVLERLTARSEGGAAVLLAGDLFDSARVYRDTRSGQWAIEDLNSTNGTVVNQQRISRPTILPARIPVRIGATTFELR